MSLPKVPNITPTITVTTKDAFNLLLISIALEEIGLSHLINAEAEKIQFVLGTLPGSHAGTIQEVLLINHDVRATLGEIIMKEMLLLQKLNTIINAFHPHHSTSSDGNIRINYPPVF